ncbi:MAG: AAA family ATPase, partial [Deltaproteobacteria bacterium]|nr:AAA family ATPase [Deltaproteobacteria bacterium]
MKKIPIGIADFAEIRREQENFFYADKTKLLYQLVKSRFPYFLSRPRRFGKTLLVNTLEHILLGHRELFKGLWIDKSDYDWTPYPVISLEMNSIKSSSPELMTASLLYYLDQIAKDEDVDILQAPDTSQAFSALIKRLNKKYSQKVAVLIDEYDAPIIKNLNQPSLADTIRQELADFYGTLKTLSGKLGHIFITGVSRFTKASIFSSLNNLIDLTLIPDFVDICGLNSSEFESLLEEFQENSLAALIADGTIAPASSKDDLKKLILNWYDGYSWDGKTKVLNPWSVFSFFYFNLISCFWYASGTPKFLKDLFGSKKMEFDLVKEPLFYDQTWNEIDKVDILDPAVVLFQTGYLTVKE